MKRKVASIAASILAITLVTTCGTDSGADDVDVTEKVAGTRRVDPERSLSLDDFTAIGFKKDKSYDVSELSGAEAAYYGFWGLDPYDRDEFEFRIYGSQEEAIELGTERAKQRTGPDALLAKDTAVWKEGIQDARQCSSGQLFNPQLGSCTSPKYYDYMFVGNVILFCPGRSIDEAEASCDELLEQLQ
jgi:hypothetical protein